MGGNASMFRIVDNRVLDLTVSVPSSRLASVRTGQTLEFTAETTPGRTFTGQVKFINPELDPANRSARIVVEILNPDGQLRSGAFVQGRIVTGQRASVLQVRKEALVNWNLDTRQAEVFLVVGDRAEKRAVTTGTGNGVSVEVLSGVKAGDQVVTRGAFALKGGDRVVVAKGEGA
jgi:RND family efflux transporter MFP subunit